jgi:predicted esterase
VSGKSVNGIAVLPKPVEKCPVVIYLHASGGSLVTDGNDLRQFAEMGLAAVGLEYDQSNQLGFDEEFTALQEFVKCQSWAQSNAVAWAGLSLGAQRPLRFLLRYPKYQPRLLVRFSGGWVPELDSYSLAPVHSSVLLIHGEIDDVFPVSDCRRLAEVLRTNGTPVAVRVFAGQSHGLGDDTSTALRGVAEYCANFFGEVRPHHINARPSYWYFCLPVLVLAMLMAVQWRLRRQGSRKNVSGPWPKASRAVLIIAWVLGLMALAVTVIQLGLPQFPASKTTLNLTRKWIVQPGQKSDFDWLTQQPLAEGLPIKILLQHLDLADLQRKFFYSELNEEMYRSFVLSPVVERNATHGLNWRRPLWENFYPRIRHETNAGAAAQIVVRFLRERVTIVPGIVESGGVTTTWERELTDASGFEALYVAALRSVGIAARLNSTQQSEYWDGVVWRPAPRPLFSSWRDLAGQ